MPYSPTPRDRLERMVHLGRKTWRYGWLVAVLAIAGIALSLAYAVTRPRRFQSWATLFYEERIQSQLLTGREEASGRTVGDRYRELLVARPQLEQIIADPSLDPFPDERDPRLKLDKLRAAIRFLSRGAGAFRIEYTDSDPERARRVTEQLTRILQDKDEAMRRDKAFTNVAFLTQQLKTEAETLDQHERALKQFLATHPEFAAPTDRARAAAAAPARQSRLDVLEAQAARIRKVLTAGPAPAVPQPPTAERLQAEAAVADAAREVHAAERALDDALAKFTDIHPAVIKARERLAGATERLHLAQAAVPAPDAAPSLTAADRTRLTTELAELDRQLALERSRSNTGSAADLTADRLVQLELESSNLHRAVAEQRERARLLSDEVFRATIAANRTLAEQGGRLSIVDPAFTPIQATGPGKAIFLMAGLLLFITLGFSLAIALAVIDDRLYRDIDIDHLGIPILAVIPPATARKRK